MQAGREAGIAAVVLAAVLWGSTGTVQALLPEGREPLAVGALRLAIGAAALLVLALVRAETRAGLRRVPWRGAIGAGLSIGAYNLLFFWAVLEAGVGVGTAVAIGSAPLWTTAYEAVILRRDPGLLRAMGQGVSILGVALLGLVGGGPAGSLAGLGLSLAAGACYAGYSLITSRSGSRAPSTSLAAATFSVAALATSPVLFLVPLGWSTTLGAWVALAFLGIGATGLSYAFYTWGLTRVAASTAVTLALAEPATAWLLATLVVQEPVTPANLAGVALILVGLAVVSWVPARR
ncbi:DMT family transporter [Histidinibacterium aquaticum]|uniref:EamA family transporter n=1 Tax=Histidinibacterium aquaticum TaxID=2613962 RepID=A0A5J5GRI3_9RHOB|nr:DMT family transporter [Histidinibacterium aquaticum]KAA9010178.1 EamA family transporter [Histidinibacterium aquaticum]